jgi:hypothetical protein
MLSARHACEDTSSPTAQHWQAIYETHWMVPVPGAMPVILFGPLFKRCADVVRLCENVAGDAVLVDH